MIQVRQVISVLVSAVLLIAGSHLVARDLPNDEKTAEAEAKATHAQINNEERMAVTGGADYASECANLLERDREWTTAIEGDNIDRVCSFWSKDAVFYFPDGKFLSGLDEIHAFVEQNREKAEMSIKRTPMHAYVTGDGTIGITQGDSKLTFRGNDGNLITQSVHYTNVWKREHGEWRCVVSSSE